MSEEDRSYTDTLLPNASVMLFSNDKETAEVFKTLENDWRYARVTFAAKEGDVEMAAKLFTTTESPDLVIIQTENIDDSFSEHLEALSSSCSEGTAAIVIGPVNDVDLYRKLVGMGISDYLVKPIAPETFANDVAATLLDQVGAAESRLIAMIGVKGGVGTTALTEGLAWGLSENLKQKTFLLDAAGGWSTLAVGIGFEPSTTLAEAGRAATEGNEDSLTRMFYSAGDRLTVLSSGSDMMLDDNVVADEYEALLDYLIAIYPVILVDLSGATPTLKRTVLARAHEIIMVSTPTLTSVRAARTLLQEIKELRGGSDDAVDFLINMQGEMTKHEVPKSQIEEGLERKAAAVISYDPDLFIGVESQAKKLTTDKDGASVVAKLLPLARKVLAGSGESKSSDSSGGKKGGLGQFLNKLTAKS